MKEVISKKLTSSAKINRYILAQFDLQDNVEHDSTLLNEIKRAFLSEEITREEMDTLFYDVYDIDTIFDNFMTPYHVAILAELGYMHNKIVEDSTNQDALYAVIQQYQYLDEIMKHPSRHVRSWAKQYYDEWYQARQNHSQILKLTNALDLTLFHLKEFDQSSVSVVPQSLTYARNTFRFNVNVRVIDCDESFTINLQYDEYPKTRCQRVERFFNEYHFKELPSLPKYPYMKCGKITGLSFEEVLDFIDRESHLEYDT